MRIISFFVILTVVMIGSSTMAQESPTTAPTTKPAKWHYYSTISDSPCAFGPRSIWFGGYTSTALVRYDTKTGQTISFTPLDGLPDNGLRRMVVGSDETTVILPNYARQAYAWKEGRGWRALPTIAEGEGLAKIEDVALAEDGRLLALVAGSIQTLNKDHWERVSNAPKATGMIPVEGGLLLLGTRTKEDPTKAKFLPLDGSGQAKPLDWKHDLYEGHGYVRLGKQVILLMGSARVGAVEGPSAAYTVTPEGLSILSEGFGISVDLKEGKTWRPRQSEKADGMLELMPEKSDSPSVSISKAHYHYLNVFRDQNGDYWNGHSRWDGHAWRPLETSWALPGVAQPWDVLGGRLKLDEKCQWQITDPQVPLNIARYDSVSRTGWRWKSGRLDAIELVEFGAGGKITIRREYISPGQAPCAPKYLDAQGNWWVGYGQISSVLVRLTPDGGSKTYDVKDPGAILSAADGSLWVDTRPPGQYLRYDPKKDRWDKGEVRDAFTFQFGLWTLANVPGPNQEYDYGTLYRMDEDGWRFFPDPFGRNTTVRGFPRMFWKDRMMVLSDGDLCEYDVVKDRWAYLTPGAWRPMFDASGRRIMVVPGAVMVLEGDPFVILDRPAVEVDQMSDLLKLMDDDNWRVRTDATAELKRKYKDRPARLMAALGNKNLSPEVSARLNQVLYELRENGGIMGSMPVESLFRRMHPLVGLGEKSP